MVCQSLVRDSLITRFNFVDPDCRVLTRLECTIIFKHVYWYMQLISGERLQDHWSSGNNKQPKKIMYCTVLFSCLQKEIDAMRSHHLLKHKLQTY